MLYSAISIHGGLRTKTICRLISNKQGQISIKHNYPHSGGCLFPAFKSSTELIRPFAEEREYTKKHYNPSKNASTSRAVWDSREGNTSSAAPTRSRGPRPRAFMPAAWADRARPPDRRSTSLVGHGKPETDRSSLA